MKKNISAIIMASGKSQRMGENKLLLKYKKVTFIENVLMKIIKEDFFSICVVVSDKTVKKICEKIVEKNKMKKIFVVENINYEKGQSESIKLGILEIERQLRENKNIENEIEKNQNLKDKMNGFMFFSGDQPLLTNKTIKKIIENFEENKIIVPKYKEKKGLPTIFSIKFKEELLQLKGDTGGKPIILNNLEKVKFVEIKNENEGIDIDTKEEYEKLRKEF